MELSKAFINLQIVLQRLLEMPIIYSSSEHRFLKNPNFSKRSNVIMWRLSILSSLTLSVLSFEIVTESLITDTWWQNLEKTAFYMMINPLANLSLVTVWTLQHNGSGYCWLLNQELLASKFTQKHRSLASVKSLAIAVCDLFAYIISQIQKHRFRILIKSITSLSARELFVYVSSLTFLCTTAVTVLLPFVISYAPLELILSGVSPSIFPIIYRKILGSILYSFTFHCGAVTVLSFLFGVVAVVEMQFELMNGLFPPNTPLRNSFVGNLGSVARFKNHYSHFRQMQIFIIQANQNVFLYAPTLTALGMTLCIAGNYIVFTSYKLIPFLIYLFVMGISVAVVIIIMIFGPLCAQPMEKYKAFVTFWKGELKSRTERRELMSCSVLAYGMAFFFRVNRHTTLDVLLSILDYTTSFVML